MTRTLVSLAVLFSALAHAATASGEDWLVDGRGNRLTGERPPDRALNARA